MISTGIRKARKKANMTQTELAAKLGINQATLSKYESGAIDPSLGQLGAIARALNTTVSEMVEEEDWSAINMKDSLSEKPFAHEFDSNDGKSVPSLAHEGEHLKKEVSPETQERLEQLAKEIRTRTQAMVMMADAQNNFLSSLGSLLGISVQIPRNTFSLPEDILEYQENLDGAEEKILSLVKTFMNEASADEKEHFFEKFDQLKSIYAEQAVDAHKYAETGEYK